MRSTLTLWLLLVLAAVPGHAQSLKGSISGDVEDAASRPVAGASVALIHEETGKNRAATSDARGGFTMSLLPPGVYRLEVERAGYRKHVQRLVLLVNQEVRVEVPLLPGSVTEQVEVTAQRPLLKTESVALGAVIDNRQVTDLPLDGRNFFELSLLAPGAVPAAEGSAGSVRGDFAIHVNGAREDSNAFLLDGVLNVDPKLNTFAVAPPVDAIREFEVLTSVYDASFGRNAGAQVNVVLRSGSNRWHGSAYEFFRNAVFDARNFFAPPAEADPKYQRNQFGTSAGGPIRKSHTFVFADYEGRRVREGITRVTNVPTLAERTGDFSRSAQPAVDLFTQRPFAGGVIPKERLHPIGLAIASLYPMPNRNVPQQNFVSSPSLRDRDDHFDARLDHAIGASGDLSVRYSFADRYLFDPFSGPTFAAVPGFGTNVPRRAQNVMASETHALSPALLNEVRAGLSRVSAGSFHQNMGNSINRLIGLPEPSTNPRDWGLSFLTITGFSPLGDEANNPQQSTTNVYQLTDQVSYARGPHLLKAGVEARAVQQNAFRDVESRGFLSFLGLTGNALAELLQGFPSVTGAAKLDNHQHLRTHSYSLFAQQSWRARPGLTLFAGLRYEFNSPPVDAQDRANVYDPARGTLAPAGKNGFPRGGYDPDRNNFAPRVGFAWTPGGGGTVVRAGYGIYYDQSALAPGEGLYFSAPYFDFRLYFPFQGFPLLLNDPFPANFPLPTPSSALAFQRNLRTANVQHWNFTLERQVGNSRTIEAAYVGSKGTHLLSGRDINQPRPSPAQFNPRPNPAFDDINILESRANSVYHSLQARFQQRLAAGLTALASYTWAKSIDDASSFFASTGDPNYPQDSANVRAERGRSNFDVRQRISVSYTYDLPFGRGRGRAAALLGGWRTAGIWTAQSGRPFTVALLPDFDNSNTGRSILGFGANDRPNRIASGRLKHRTPDLWFDTSAFSIPPRGSFGNSGRNILDGPSRATVSASLIKHVKLSEAASLEFRAEAFNLFNRTNFDLPDLFVGSPTFGRIQSAGSPRHVQFGVKALF